MLRHPFFRSRCDRSQRPDARPARRSSRRATSQPKGCRAGTVQSRSNENRFRPIQSARLRGGRRGSARSLHVAACIPRVFIAQRRANNHSKAIVADRCPWNRRRPYRAAAAVSESRPTAARRNQRRSMHRLSQHSPLSPNLIQNRRKPHRNRPATSRPQLTPRPVHERQLFLKIDRQTASIRSPGCLCEYAECLRFLPRRADEMLAV